MFVTSWRPCSFRANSNAPKNWNFCARYSKLYFLKFLISENMLHSIGLAERTRASWRHEHDLEWSPSDGEGRECVTTSDLDRLRIRLLALQHFICYIITQKYHAKGISYFNVVLVDVSLNWRLVHCRRPWFIRDLKQTLKHCIDGSENVTWKWNFAFPQSLFNYSKSLRLQNVF